MQINKFSTDPIASGGGLAVLPVQALGAATLLRDPSASANLGEQLSAYQDLSSQWRGARNIGQRAALAHVLNTSPFGQRVDRAVNGFTRAAWAGADAVPPKPQVKMLEAFDNLSADDQQIVAALQTDPGTGAAFTSAADFRARLQSNVDDAQSGRQPDQVTLSPQAQAYLAGASPKVEPSTPPADGVNPQLAKVLAAYVKAGG